MADRLDYYKKAAVEKKSKLQTEYLHELLCPHLEVGIRNVHCI